MKASKTAVTLSLETEKGDLSITVYLQHVIQTHIHAVVKLPPAVRWEIEKVPRERRRLDKDISRQTVESTNCFYFVLFLFLAACEKVHEK